MSGMTDKTKEINEVKLESLGIEEGISRDEAIAEALIFASGSPVKLESIAIALKKDKKEANIICEKLIADYAKRNGGISLRRAGNTFFFCSKPELREDLRDFFEKPGPSGLSRAAMETLSIIAYNQPITRGGIEYVRGVNSDGVLVRLIEKDLVEEKGRSDAPGRPILYGTTNKFLVSLGLESLKELPKIEKIDFTENVKIAPENAEQIQMKEEFENG